MKENSEILMFAKPQVHRVTETILLMDWTNKFLYADFLAQTYFHICHSTRLLAAAGSRFQVSQDKLHLHCMKHSDEERSHEKLAISDLKTLGFSLDDFPELPSTKALYRSAYYLIDRVSPVAIFGYAYFLECMALSAGTEIGKIAQSHFGLKGTKHLNVHAKEDADHIKAYEHILDEFSGTERECLKEAITNTADYYERIFLEISGRSIREKARKAA